MHSAPQARPFVSPPSRCRLTAVQLSFLGEYGWRVREHLGYDELGERYVNPTGRELMSMAVERIVYAEKLGSALG